MHIANGVGDDNYPGKVETPLATVTATRLPGSLMWLKFFLIIHLLLYLCLLCYSENLSVNNRKKPFRWNCTPHLCETITNVYLVNKRVQLCCFIGLIQLLLSFVDILLYSLPVHFDIASVVSYLQRKPMQNTLKMHLILHTWTQMNIHLLMWDYRQ